MSLQTRPQLPRIPTDSHYEGGDELTENEETETGDDQQTSAGSREGAEDVSTADGELKRRLAEAGLFPYSFQPKSCCSSCGDSRIRQGSYGPSGILLSDVAMPTVSFPFRNSTSTEQLRGVWLHPCDRFNYGQDLSHGPTFGELPRMISYNQTPRIGETVRWKAGKGAFPVDATEKSADLTGS